MLRLLLKGILHARAGHFVAGTDGGKRDFARTHGVSARTGRAQSRDHVPPPGVRPADRRRQQFS